MPGPREKLRITEFAGIVTMAAGIAGIHCFVPHRMTDFMGEHGEDEHIEIVGAGVRGGILWRGGVSLEWIEHQVEQVAFEAVIFVRGSVSALKFP